MKKLKAIALLLLLIFPKCFSAPATDFKKLSLNDFKPALQYKAPENIYIMVDIGNNWLIINSFFLNSIHLKLAEYEAHKKIVEPITTNPENMSWYQEKPIIIVSFPIFISVGTIIGLMLK